MFKISPPTCSSIHFCSNFADARIYCIAEWKKLIRESFETFDYRVTQQFGKGGQLQADFAGCLSIASGCGHADFCNLLTVTKVISHRIICPFARCLMMLMPVVIFDCACSISSYRTETHVDCASSVYCRSSLRMCTFWERGSCKRGTACAFAHGEAGSGRLKMYFSMVSFPGRTCPKKPAISRWFCSKTLLLLEYHFLKLGLRISWSPNTWSARSLPAFGHRKSCESRPTCLRQRLSGSNDSLEGTWRTHFLCSLVAISEQ